MNRVQSLFFSGTILLLMVLKIASEMLDNSPDEIAWVSTLNVALCALVAAAAFLLLLRTWIRPGDGLPFLIADQEARKRARKRVLILLPLGTFAMLLLIAYLRGSGMDQSTLNTAMHTSGLVYPLLGLIAVVGLHRARARGQCQKPAAQRP
jgi:archaellum biogenesis protein FlaJ (TadC family)